MTKISRTQNSIAKIGVVNFITFSRIGILFFAIKFSNPFFLLFVSSWAAFSDFLDGYLSRKFDCITDFGRQFDQVADKAFTIFFFLLLYSHQEIHLWFILMFFAREIMIMVGRELGWFSKHSNFLGKLKIFLVYAFIIAVYFNTSFQILGKTDLYVFKNTFEYVILLVSFLSLYQSLISPKKNTISHRFSIFLGSGFYSSFWIKKMPGTISTLFFMGLCFMFKETALDIKISIFIAASLFHFYLYKSYVDWSKKEDPSSYTLDELVAVLFFWLLPFSLPLSWVFGFLVFRFFDILKPFGIRYLERDPMLSPAMQVLADDLLAIFYTIILTYFFETAFIL